jgi:hypothetical protein
MHARRAKMRAGFWGENENLIHDRLAATAPPNRIGRSQLLPLAERGLRKIGIGTLGRVTRQLARKRDMAAIFVD